MNFNFVFIRIAASLLFAVTSVISYADESNPCEKGAANALRECGATALQESEAKMKEAYTELLNALPKKTNPSNESWSVTKSDLVKAQALWRKSASANCSIRASLSLPTWQWGSAQYDLCLAGNFDERTRTLESWKECAADGDC